MFEVKQPEKIKAGIMAALETDIDKREGSFSDDMAGPLAVELYKMYDALKKIQPMVWVDDTSGPYLDMAGEDLGMEPRKQGIQAQVILQIKGAVGYAIPAGTTFMTAEDELFDTLYTTIIPDSGVALVEARARNAGVKYNVEAGSIKYSYINDTRLEKVTNPAPAIGGTDTESDKSLYARLVMARQRPATSGNVYHYEMWALEVPGVGAVKVFPLWNGNGTVKVLIADDNRQPVDQAVVKACFEHIEAERPTTARVTVVSASRRTVDVEVSVKLADRADQVEVIENIKQSIAEYFMSISLNQYEVRYNRLGAIIMEVDGVIDYDNLTLNGQERSVTLSQEEVPVLGEVELQWI